MGGCRHIHGFGKRKRVGYETSEVGFETLLLSSEHQQRLRPQNRANAMPDSGPDCRIVVHIARARRFVRQAYRAVNGSQFRFHSHWYMGREMQGTEKKRSA